MPVACCGASSPVTFSRMPAGTEWLYQACDIAILPLTLNVPLHCSSSLVYLPAAIHMHCPHERGGQTPARCISETHALWCEPAASCALHHEPHLIPLCSPVQTVKVTVSANGRAEAQPERYPILPYKRPYAEPDWRLSDRENLINIRQVSVEQPSRGN